MSTTVIRTHDGSVLCYCEICKERITLGEQFFEKSLRHRVHCKCDATCAPQSTLRLVSEQSCIKVRMCPVDTLKEHLGELQLVIRSFEIAYKEDPERWGTEWLGNKLDGLRKLQERYVNAIYILGNI